MLPPTSPSLRSGDVRPYFLWWLDATVDDFRKELATGDPERRAYFMGALLREANTRDVWLYVTPDEVRQMWDHVQRHLGTSRAMWAFLLGLPALEQRSAPEP